MKDGERRGAALQVRGSALLSLGRVLALLFSIATQVIIVRFLSKGDYGVFAYGLAVSAALQALLSLGQNRSLGRSLAVAEEQGDVGRLLGALVLVASTIATCAVAVLVFLLVFQDLVLPAVPGEASELAPLLVLLLLAPLDALDQVFVSFFAAMARPLSIFFRKYLLSPALRLGIVVLVVLLDGSLMQLAVGYVGAQVVALISYGLLTAPVLRERGALGSRTRPRVVLRVREVFRLSLPLLSADLVFLSLHSGNVVLLGSLSGAAAVAAYYAVYSSARLNEFLSTSFQLLYLPTVSRLQARGDLAGVREAYRHSTAVLFVATFPIFLMTVPFAQQTTVLLLGERYAPSADVLALLASSFFLNACFGFNALTLQVFGRLRPLLATNVATASVNLALSLALIPVLGAAGVGVAVLVSRGLQHLSNQLVLRRTLGGGLLSRNQALLYAGAAGLAAAAFILDAVAEPPFVLALGASALASLMVLRLSRRELRLLDDFPELARLPLLPRLLSSH